MSTATLAVPAQTVAAPRPETRRPSDETTDPASLVVDNVDLVDKVLGYLKASWPAHVDRDDLYSAGQLALVECAERWDPDTGVPFGSYARQRIKGAMLDALRDSDWAPRSVRERVRLVEHARAEFRQTHGREATHHDLASTTSLTTRQIDTALAGVARARVQSIDVAASEGDSTYAELLLCPATGAEQRVEDIEIRAELAGAIASLDDKARAVIVGIYLDGRPLAEIGEELGVTDSRISQIHHQTLRLLDAMLRRKWEHDHPADDDRDERRARSYEAAIDRYRKWHAAQQGQLLAAASTL